ncbi:Rib/alpha-like domain-containing protein, partial [Enterococcus sp. 5B3_DIV0040]|uniref:Rib/alpha-like domain-containing protein n=1 Tax=Enterococcus sp. 5B3_DIV0040 TaxID=1834182 RepID=UPI000A3348EC
GSTVEVVEAVTSETAGTFEAKVKVIFENGSSRTVTVPVIVKERIPASTLEEIPSIPAENILSEEVYQGDPIVLEDNLQGLPDGSVVEVVEAVTSETAGTFEGKVKVTFANGSSRIVTVPVTVKERIPATTLEEIPSIPSENILSEEVYQGDPVTLEDNVQGLPDGSTVEVVEAVTSETAGTFEAKVKVTFANGSSRIVTVPVTVKEQAHSSSTKEESSIPAESIPEEVGNQEEPIPVEDHVQDLSEDSITEGENRTSIAEEESSSDKPIEDRSQGDSKDEKDSARLVDERKLPETGDTSNLFSLLGGLFLSAIGVVGILLKWNHRKKTYED